MVGVGTVVKTQEAEQALRRAQQALDPAPLLEAIGARLLAWVDENFRRHGAERPWAPLKPSTIAGRRRGKGSGAPQPLRDTGRLAQSFVREITGHTVWVGTRDQRAPWHHYGTAPYRITTKPPGRPARRNPGRRGALRFVGPSGEYVFRREVQHPGLPARPLIPSARLARELAEGVVAAYIRRVRDAAD
jgi:phage gpG-like protein